METLWEDWETIPVLLGCALTRSDTLNWPIGVGIWLREYRTLGSVRSSGRID